MLEADILITLFSVFEEDTVIISFNRTFAALQKVRLFMSLHLNINEVKECEQILLYLKIVDINMNSNYTNYIDIQF